MRLLKIFIQDMPRFKENIDIDFITKQRVAEDDQEKLFNTFSNNYTSIYTNQAISFIGLNASGKTTILKAISFVINLLNNEALNNIKSKEILNDLSDNEKVKITSFFYNDNSVYKLETHIEKRVNQVDNESKLIITEERLWEKDATKVKTKKSLFEFNDSDIRIERNEKEQFLLNDVSVMIAINKEKQSNFPLRDMLMWTNHNMLNILGKFPKELLTFLDPSIEYFKCDIRKKPADIRLKFYESEEIILNNPSEIEKYLSSGTIKGINVFMNALLCFMEGGYLIVDELEKNGISCVGPSQSAARIETDKSFMRKLFEDYNIEGSLVYKVFDNYDDVSAFLDDFDRDVVVKPVGLTGGKGVKIVGDHLKDNHEAKEYSKEVIDNAMGGFTQVIIEETLE